MAKKSKIKAKQPKASDVFTREFDNPLFQKGYAESRTNQKTISRQYNPKESPVTFMYAKGYVSASQERSASEFRRLYELTGGGGVKAIDYSKTKVDGGSFGSSLTDSRMDAENKLAQVKDTLGNEGYELVRDVCGQCLWINAIRASRYEQIKAGRQLKECLSALSVFWGYETGRTRSWRSAA